MGAVFTCKVIANKLNSMINCSICAVMLNDASCMEESNQEYESILHIVRLVMYMYRTKKGYTHIVYTV